MKRVIKNHRFKDLFNTKGEPKIVAKGFAMGSIIVMLPFSGIQRFISVGLVTFLIINKTTAIAGVLDTNLVTGAFVFAFNYWLGNKILGFESTFQMPERINLEFTQIVFNAGADVIFAPLLGGLITGTFAFIIRYYLTLLVLTGKRKTHAH